MALTLQEVFNIHKNHRMDKEVWDVLVDFLGKFLDTPDNKVTEGINVAGIGLVSQDRIEGIIEEIRKTHIDPLVKSIAELNQTPVELKSEQQNKKKEANKPGSAGGKKTTPKVRRRTGNANKGARENK